MMKNSKNYNSSIERHNEDIKMKKTKSLQQYTLEERRRCFTAGLKNYGLTWVMKTFKKKNCTHFIPRQTDKYLCGCGRLKAEHQHRSVQFDAEGKWQAKQHTTEVKTNSYGEIVFQGTGKKTRAKYIRVSDETDPNQILKLMRKVWMMEYPQLLISVTGGAKAFKLNPKLKAHFTDGLLKVVQTTCTWVVTGGTNTGVMKHVGEALQGATTNVYCVGIATWGIVNDRKRLKNHDVNCASNVDYHVSSSMETSGACLDNNHSHFILVDGGMVNSYGHEIKLRGNVEQAVCNMSIEKNREKMVPGVQLVLEGGPNTIVTVLSAITQNPPMPVVVIKGSGRAADLLAAAHQLTRGEGPLYEMHEVVEHKQLLDMVEHTFHGMPSETHQQVYHNLLKCVEKKEYITIYKMEDGDCHIDEAILIAFMKGNNINAFEQLDLAMLWNRVDIARNNIFADDTKWTLEELHVSMYNALRRNKPEFVQLLLENGVVMCHFLTTTKLEDLYEYQMKESGRLLKQLCKTVKDRSSGTIKMNHIDLVLMKLCGGFHIRSEEYRHQTIANKLVMAQGKPDVRAPINELFIWAVLCNMDEMAMMLWSHGDGSMAKALVGRQLYLSMANHARKYHKEDYIIQDLEKQAEKFGNLAIDLLNEAFHTDERYAGDLVTHNLTNWGNQTCLSLAVLSHLLGFVAHPCCQSLLTEKWTDALQFTGVQFPQVLLGLLFPPFVMKLNFKSLKEYKLLLMTENEFRALEDEEQTQEQEREQNTKIRQQNKQQMKESIPFTYHEDSIELVSMSDRSGTLNEVSSNERIIEKTHEMPWFMKYMKFYNAPVTKFYANLVMYIIFLLLFIFVITTELPRIPFTTEWVLVFTVCSYTTEEIRQVLESDAQSLRHKVRQWSCSYWNLCDALAIVLFFVSFGFRLNDNTRIVGHALYAVDIIFWILRVLEMFAASKNLGPYVVMIGNMTIDMANFLLVLLVFTLAYGVSRYVILNPFSKRSWGTMGELFLVPYFQIYGELFLEIPQNDPNSTIFETKTFGQKHIQGLVAIIMAGYLLITNILLINLLIAIFNNTYTRVQANSNEIWKFQRYNLIKEFSTKPALFPPFSIFINIYTLLKWVIRQCFVRHGGHEEQMDRKLKKFLGKDDLHDVILFEERCLTNYMRHQNSIHSATQEEKLRVISDKVDCLTKNLDKYTDNSSTTRKAYVKTTTEIKDRVENLENMMRSMITKVTEVHNAMNLGTCAEDRSSYHNSQSNILRSVSEYPGGGDAYDQNGPPSPYSVPTGVYPFPRRKSAFSLNFPAKAYPNRKTDRSSVVKRAAHNFRKLSLKKSQLLDTTDGPPQKSVVARSHSVDVSNVVNENSTQTSLRRRAYSNEGLKSLRSTLPTICSQNTDSGDGASTPSSLQHNVHTLHREMEIDETTFDDSNEGVFDTVDGLNVGRNGRDAGGDSYDRLDVGYNGLDGGHPRLHDSVSESSVNLTFNKLSRTPDYPFSNVKRDSVPDSLVPWEVQHEFYNPPSYTSPTVSPYLPWTDPDPSSEKFSQIKFNDVDDNGVNKVSCHGDYDIINSLPRNPLGRTGITGRGLLCRFGPNHIQFPLITRWKKNAFSFANDHSDQLELLVMVHKNGKLALPSGPETMKQNLPADLSRFFSAKTLQSNGVTVATQKSILDGLAKIIMTRKLIYEGYMDDKRNTDNAWIEVCVYNYHDEDNTAFTKFICQVSSETDDTVQQPYYQWKDLDADLPLLLSETYDCLETLPVMWLNKTVEEHGAFFE